MDLLRNGTTIPYEYVIFRLGLAAALALHNPFQFNANITFSLLLRKTFSSYVLLTAYTNNYAAKK